MGDKGGCHEPALACMVGDRAWCGKFVILGPLIIISTLFFLSAFSKCTVKPLNGATRKAGLDLAWGVEIGKGQF